MGGAKSFSENYKKDWKNGGLVWCQMKFNRNNDTI